MTKAEAGRLGGLATKHNHIEFCPLCRQVIPSSYYKRNGKKGGQIGGQVTRDKYGSQHFSNLGKKGKAKPRSIKP